MQNESSLQCEVLDHLNQLDHSTRGPGDSRVALNGLVKSPSAALLARGDLIIDPDFDFSVEVPRLLELCRKYADRPMDIAAACLVRMTELTARCKLWTVDRDDFSAYRRHGRQHVPCEFPPESSKR